MNTETDFLISQNGEKLFYHHWYPSEPEQVICIIHGHGEHSGRYEDLAQFLCSHQIAVLAMDLRGHGHSYGKRGHSPSYGLLLAEIEELLKTARADYNNVPLFIMGHSMGGNLVASWVIENMSKEISGFILSSPWLKLAFEPNPIKLKLGKVMNRIWPSYSEDNDLNIDALSRDPKIIEAHHADTLVHNKISARLFHVVTQAAENIIKNVSKIKIPGLVYHGDADTIVDYHSTKEFASKNSLMEWLSLDGVFHEPHNDLGKEKVYVHVKNWIKTKATK